MRCGDPAGRILFEPFEPGFCGGTVAETDGVDPASTLTQKFSHDRVVEELITAQTDSSDACTDLNLGDLATLTFVFTERDTDCAYAVRVLSHCVDQCFDVRGSRPEHEDRPVDAEVVRCGDCVFKAPEAGQTDVAAGIDDHDVSQVVDAAVVVFRCESRVADQAFFLQAIELIGNPARLEDASHVFMRPARSLELQQVHRVAPESFERRLERCPDVVEGISGDLCGKKNVRPIGQRFTEDALVFS